MTHPLMEAVAACLMIPMFTAAFLVLAFGRPMLFAKTFSLAVAVICGAGALFFLWSQFVAAGFILTACAWLWHISAPRYPSAQS